MIALLCATALWWGVHTHVFTFPSDPAPHAGMVLKSKPDGILYWTDLWKFTMYFHGRAIVIDGWESERECREMRDRMRRQYPDARMTDCEESR